MENKKFIIITIVLFLLAGTGTFVFAGQDRNDNGENAFTEDDINYKKVDNSTNKAGQQVPVINNTTTTENNNNGVIIDDTTDENNSSNTTNGTGSSQTRPSQNSGSGSNRNPGSNSGSSNGTNNGNNTGSQVNGGTQNNTPTGGNNSDQKDDNGNNNDSTDNNEVPELNAELIYSNVSPTNQNVTVKIVIPEDRTIDHLSENDWIIKGNIATKTFTENTQGKIEITVYDKLNKSKKLEYEVSNIDRVKPILEVNYSEQEKTFRPITVTIKTKNNKEIKEVSEEDWTFSNDAHTEIFKTFEGKVNSTITVRDIAGNESTITYNTNNYEDKPIISTIKGEDSTTITLTYKEPTKDADNWEKLENGDYKASIEIKNNDSTSITLPDGDTINIFISNKVNGISQKTNKPVIVTIVSNKELQDLDGWITSTDKKSLIKFVYESETKTIEVFDLNGNSNTIKYTVTNVDTKKPEISKIDYTKNINGTYTIKINLTEVAAIDNDTWSKNTTYTRLFKKSFTEEELINGIIETLTFTDKYENKNTQTIKISYINNEIIREIINQ